MIVNVRNINVVKYLCLVNNIFFYLSFVPTGINLKNVSNTGNL